MSIFFLLLNSPSIFVAFQFMPFNVACICMLGVEIDWNDWAHSNRYVFIVANLNLFFFFLLNKFMTTMTAHTEQASDHHCRTSWCRSKAQSMRRIESDFKKKLTKLWKIIKWKWDQYSFGFITQKTRLNFSYLAIAIHGVHEQKSKVKAVMQKKRYTHTHSRPIQASPSQAIIDTIQYAFQWFFLLMLAVVAILAERASESEERVNQSIY